MKIARRNSQRRPPEEKPGTRRGLIQVCQWLKDDAWTPFTCRPAFFRIQKPGGRPPMDELRKTYDSPSRRIAGAGNTCCSPAIHRGVVQSRWEEARGPKDQSRLNLPDARAIKQAVGTIPAVHGGIQTGAIIARRLREVIATADHRAPLIANNDLVTSSPGSAVQQSVHICNRCW